MTNDPRTYSQVPEEAEETTDKCPKCHVNLLSWYEGYADFAYQVWYCPQCEERTQE